MSSFFIKLKNIFGGTESERGELLYAEPDSERSTLKAFSKSNI